MRRVGPATDREEYFETAVALLEEVELFEGAVDVVTRVIPGVGGVVLVSVGPGVSEEDFAGLGAHIC